jgi:hypothetical protein
MWTKPIRTGPFVSLRGNFGYQAHYLQFIYKGYIFIYNPNLSSEKDQSRFDASILTGYETIMILPKPAR